MRRFACSRVQASLGRHRLGARAMASSTGVDPFANAREKIPKILIANRGEIARRVIRTARKMGIKSVAVYSDADASAMHVREADEAVCIGPAPSVESYLVIDKLIAACKQTGAKGVHPGYGFLSENKDFQKALESEGIRFIGPGEYAITGMGDKIMSKAIAKDAGVSCIPGNPNEIEDPEVAVEVAKEIGYPVMVKASAGGGGKGMRVAWDDEGTREAYRLSKAEAASSFGDDRLLIEKFVEEPRHIEIQVIADSFGNTVYLPERECSIQRRNQKVVEEAPSAFVDPDLRKRMGEQAVALAKAVQYQSAGTVEFIVDKHGKHFFLEMNTRLQVEHPITEEITGLDLVEHMIRVAAGEELSIKQEDVGINGWAIESRVYAEDPLKDFLPSVGVLTHYEEPLDAPGVRCDSGVSDGSEISMYYDPMISKLVTHGKDRDEAISRMRVALNQYVIRGVNHNVPLLYDIMENKTFTSAGTNTDFIKNEYPDGFKVNFTPTKQHQLLCMAALIHQISQKSSASFLADQGKFGFQPAVESSDIVVQLGEDMPRQSLNVSQGTADGEILVRIDGEDTQHSVTSSWDRSSAVVKALIGSEEVIVQALKQKTNGYTIQQHGSVYDVMVQSKAVSELQKLMPVLEKVDFSKYVVAPISGTIQGVAVAPGDEVVAGAEVAVLEAMKMHNVLRSERSGTVKAVHFVPGDVVEADDFIVEFE